jgi:serine protease Do
MNYKNILLIVVLASASLFQNNQSCAQVPEYYELLISRSKHVVGIISYKTMSLSEIKKSSRFNNLFGSPGQEEGNDKQSNETQNNKIQRVLRGVGFFVTTNGYIVTHDAVVKGADRVEITLNDRTVLPASIVGMDPLNGIGVLKVSGGVYTATSIGKSENVRIGDWVLAIGAYPVENHAVIGTLTAKGNDHPSIPIGAYLQFSGLLSQQNTGAPLFNRDGDAIGMIIPQGQHYLFKDKNSLATPIEVVMNVAKQIITHGKTNRMMLGISVIDYDGRKIKLNKHGNGMVPMIAEVQENGLGKKSGILVGDIILDFNGMEITSPGRLIQLLSLTSPDEHVVLTVLRNGRTIAIPIYPD